MGGVGGSNIGVGVLVGGPVGNVSSEQPGYQFWGFSLLDFVSLSYVIYVF